MPAFPCPALGAFVELHADREEQILLQHPEIEDRFTELVETTLAEPDLVDRRADRPEIGVLRFWPDLRDGHFVVVIVRSDRDPGAESLRYWVVTVYITRNIETWKSMWETR